MDPASNEANYKFLFVKLIGSEKGALPKLKAADTLEEKVVAFEAAFERAGVKADAKRQQWARIALDALGNSADEPEEERPEQEVDDDPAYIPQSTEKPAARTGCRWPSSSRWRRLSTRPCGG